MLLDVIARARGVEDEEICAATEELHALRPIASAPEVVRREARFRPTLLGTPNLYEVDRSAVRFDDECREQYADHNGFRLTPLDDR